MKKYIFWIFLPLVLGSIEGILFGSSFTYQNLNTPLFTPPSILFPIAWSILYLLIGISYFLYRKNYEDKGIIFIYYIQLFINLTWSLFFFLFNARLFSLLWILLLDSVVYTLLNAYKKRSKVSFYLNIPYFFWILFATYLTIGFYILNV